MDDLDDSAKLTLEVAEAEQGKRLDHLLAKHFPDISRSRIKALIVDGKVLIEAVVMRAPAHRVKTVGSAVAMQVPAAVSVDLVAQDLPLEILFEDEHLIIINKAAGMVVHPAPGHPANFISGPLLPILYTSGCTQLVSLSELYLNDVFLEYLPANFGRLNKLKILELRNTFHQCDPHVKINNEELNVVLLMNEP